MQDSRTPVRVAGMGRWLVAPLAAVVLAACAHDGPASQQSDTASITPVQTHRASFDPERWYDSRPMELIAYLKTGHGLTIREKRSDWVRAEDIPALMLIMDSRETCGTVVLEASSRIVVYTDVGQEARFIITGYFRGRYPPGLTSERNVMSAEEIRRAWASLNPTGKP
ncbi:MAG: hypothetical protein ACYC26_04085 [Phycisphaerales bacterium]